VVTTTQQGANFRLHTILTTGRSTRSTNNHNPRRNQPTTGGPLKGVVTEYGKGCPHVNDKSTRTPLNPPHVPHHHEAKRNAPAKTSILSHLKRYRCLMKRHHTPSTDHNGLQGRALHPCTETISPLVWPPCTNPSIPHYGLPQEGQSTETTHVTKQTSSRG